MVKTQQIDGVEQGLTVWPLHKVGFNHHKTCKDSLAKILGSKRVVFFCLSTFSKVLPVGKSRVKHKHVTKNDILPSYQIFWMACTSSNTESYHSMIFRYASLNTKRFLVNSIPSRVGPLAPGWWNPGPAERPPRRPSRTDRPWPWPSENWNDGAVWWRTVDQPLLMAKELLMGKRELLMVLKISHLMWDDCEISTNQ